MEKDNIEIGMKFQHITGGPILVVAGIRKGKVQATVWSDDIETFDCWEFVPQEIKKIEE